MYYKRNIEVRSRNNFCRGKTIRITYSEYASVALIMQHEKRIRLILLSSLACPVQLYFSILSHKRHDFRENEFVVPEML